MGVLHNYVAALQAINHDCDGERDTKVWRGELTVAAFKKMYTSVTKRAAFQSEKHKSNDNNELSCLGTSLAKSHESSGEVGTRDYQKKKTFTNRFALRNQCANQCKPVSFM